MSNASLQQMALAQRRGWIRLGVVLSIAWVVGVFAYAISDHYALRADAIATVDAPEPATPPVVTRWDIVGQQSFLTECDIKYKLVTCSPRVLNLALLTFLPIVGGWLIVVLIVYAVLWIRAGFRSDEP